MRVEHASEHWHELCQKITVEQDPVKLLDLCQQVNRLYEEHEEFRKQRFQLKSAA